MPGAISNTSSGPDVIATIVPLYLAIAAGFLATRLGLFRREEMASLSKFVISFAVPALLVLALAKRSPAEVANPTYLLSFAFALLGTLGVALVISRFVNRASPVAAVFDGMSSSCPNSGFFGFNVLLVTSPGIAGLALGMNMLVENLLVIPLILALAERARVGGLTVGERWITTARQLARNPLVLAIVTGQSLSVAGVALPPFVEGTFDIFAQATTAVALFAVGGMLVGLRVTGQVRRILSVVGAKLVLAPALAAAAYAVLVGLGLPELDADLRRALVLSAGMPPFVTSTILAAQYGEEAVPPAALVVGTGLSFATVAGLLVLTST